MNKKRKVFAFLLLASIVFTTSCSDNKIEDSVAQTTTPIQESRGDLDISDVPAIGQTDSNFKKEIEAETAEFFGNTRVESNKNGYTGDGFVVGLETDDDFFEIVVDIEEAGIYDLNFITATLGGSKENTVILNGSSIGSIKTVSETFADTYYRKAFLEEGENKIGLKKNWGWIAVDKLIITGSGDIDTEMYQVDSKLINPNASEITRRLYNFLTEVYGKYTISGQQSDGGIEGREIIEIKKLTGEYPAILGLDLIDATPSRVANGSTSNAFIKGAEWWGQGGLVTMCWHWNAPEEYLYNTSQQPWYRGFYTDATNIKLDKILSGEDTKGYELLMRDIDAIAVELKKYQDAGIPLLWRPLHEASGGWFWWGAAGPEACTELWKIMYDKLTNEHGLNNLIWVWNGQSKDWYPGDEYVDIIGEDIYPGEKVYSSQSGKFNEAVDYTNTNKIVAMTENGCVFDVELAFRDNARWAWFCTWVGEFVVGKNGQISDQFTEKEMLKKVYSDKRTITRDKVPDISIYPLGNK